MSDSHASAPGTEPPVVVARKGHVLRITLNRPRAMNALNAEVARGVAEAVDELDRDPGLRVAVLSGEGATSPPGWTSRRSWPARPPSSTVAACAA